MDFNNMVDSHRSQIKFYQLSCLALIAVLGLLAVVVPSSLKTGPYVVHESDSLASVAISEPWKLTVGRVEGFLKLFLGARFEWSKETFDQKRSLLQAISTDAVISRLKDSIIGYGAVAKAQDARGYYLLEGFRFANEQHLIEAQVSRILRIGNTGVVTPLKLKLTYEDAAISDANPYGLRVKSVEEGEISTASGVSK